MFAQPIALADLKPGDFLGVTSVKNADGKLIAYEVRRFPEAGESRATVRSTAATTRP